ncbi:type III-A CRISPR-associated RAMP protein Csm4 [Anaerocellum danielii]|uniref:CRISPR system Cms protein Csm4 n=1 Tax=Anaerocellum danielii TaxID=1387557 RepID=A0ABZ0TZC1_9FIRM|nr:type III-A CRISPR-associated RAMP protein Csm4 [Caldicellulosiruptor danielii]WPX08755.1 type III-A CRISPR-associated RAMP protein Csm4 [Caldicellulosiruptor danielii]
MDKNRIYRVVMNFIAPVHIGEKEKLYNITRVFAHSDTLMSGIINAYSLLYGKDETDKLLEEFLKGTAPFEVSSTMPYVNLQYFMPVPLGLNMEEYKNRGIINAEHQKELKKIKFVREKDLFEGFQSKYKPVGSFLIPQNEFENDNKKSFSLGRTKERARVFIDRQTSSSNIYYFSHFEFEKESGLWFYLKINNEKVENKVKAAIRLLGDEGLGGDRTCGLGSFKVDFKDDVPEFKNIQSGYYMSLSIINPKDEDEIKSVVFYEILTRSGYIYSKAGLGIKRKTVSVFGEGTVFSNKIQGRVVDVTPEKFSSHRVYCFGLAFLVPLPEGVMLFGC